MARRRRQKQAKAPHVHMYQRMDLGRHTPYIVMKCALPDCMHHVSEALAVGKQSLCNRCKTEVFTLDLEAIKRKKPHCPNCTKTYNYTKGYRHRLKPDESVVEEGRVVKKDKVTSLLDEILGGKGIL